MELNGKIKFLSADIQVSASFVKRELVVTTDEQYPQHILIHFVQDKCDILDKYKVGDFVDVGINIRGREWTSPTGEVKYFNDIQGWKINHDKERTANHYKPDPLSPVNKTVVVDIEDDDMPF